MGEKNLKTVQERPGMSSDYPGMSNQGQSNVGSMRAALTRNTQQNTALNYISSSAGSHPLENPHTKSQQNMNSMQQVAQVGKHPKNYSAVALGVGASVPLGQRPEQAQAHTSQKRQ